MKAEIASFQTLVYSTKLLHQLPRIEPRHEEEWSDIPITVLLYFTKVRCIYVSIAGFLIKKTFT